MTRDCESRACHKTKTHAYIGFTSLRRADSGLDQPPKPRRYNPKNESFEENIPEVNFNIFLPNHTVYESPLLQIVTLVGNFKFSRADAR